MRCKDLAIGKTLIFLTNTTTLSEPVIALLNKNRWQVKLFFIWFMQHLRNKRSLCHSENAVKTQVSCAIVTYFLIANVKKELQLNSSLFTCLQILSVSCFKASFRFMRIADL